MFFSLFSELVKLRHLIPPFQLLTTTNENPTIHVLIFPLPIQIAIHAHALRRWRGTCCSADKLFPWNGQERLAASRYANQIGENLLTVMNFNMLTVPWYYTRFCCTIGQVAGLFRSSGIVCLLFPIVLLLLFFIYICVLSKRR